jgi:hypothetical protein
VETIDMPRPGARGWARVGLYGGLLLSLAGNEAHVWGHGYPGPGPAVASVIWPALLFVALEIVLHMGPGFIWAKWVGLGSVAAVSGAVSYWHLSSVLHSWGYGPLSWFGPLAVDGLMVMSTVVLARMVPAPAAPVPTRVPVRVFAGPHSIPGPAVAPEPLWFPKPQPEPEVQPVPQPSEPERVTPGPAEKPAAPERGPERRSHTVHMRMGKALSGPDLKADAVALVRAEGLSNAQLAKRYTPELPTWRAREFVSEARKPGVVSVNGHRPDVTIP